MKDNNILILIIFVVIIYFLIDYLINYNINNKLNKKIENFKGSYQKHIENGYNIEKFSTSTKKPYDKNKELYLKQYINKLLSANKSDKIVKLNVKNNDIDIDFIFNNVLDYEKINDNGDNNNVIVIDNNKDNKDNENNNEYTLDSCANSEINKKDNNEFIYTIKIINDGDTEFPKYNKFEIYIKKVDKSYTYKLEFDLKADLMTHYNNNDNLDIILNNANLKYKYENGVDDNNEIIYKTMNNINSNITKSEITFSDFTVKRLNDFHKKIEEEIETNLLKDANDNLREFNKIRNNINKLENYYKFQKSLNDELLYKVIN